MDLNAPLGLRPPPKPPRRFGRASVVVVALAAAAGLAGLGVALWTADPHGGEPYAVATIPPAAPKPAKPSAPPLLDTASTASIAPTVPPVRPMLPADMAATAVPGAGKGPLIIDVAKALADREHGSVATTQPSLQAPAVPPPSGPEPKVAIFIGGMGLNEGATRTATEIMPPAVTFAFVPTGEAVAAEVAVAKAKGHEILLQVPMQNASGATLGQHALRPGEAPQDVAADLAWLGSRFGGYDGIANLLGAPVTADRGVMSALLKDVAQRGLFYVDDGTSRRSLTRALALEQQVAAGRADVVLDATPDPQAVRTNLETLIEIAKRNGSAIGMASGLPDHLASVAAFASGLGARGIKLVPVSALVARGPSVMVAQ